MAFCRSKAGNWEDFSAQYALVKISHLCIRNKFISQHLLKIMSTVAELLYNNMKDELFGQHSPRSEASQISRIVKYCRLGSGPDAAVDPLLTIVSRHFKVA